MRSSSEVCLPIPGIYHRGGRVDHIDEAKVKSWHFRSASGTKPSIPLSEATKSLVQN